jgi:hypothetical protein
MTLHDWSEVATVAQGVVAFVAAVVATIAARLIVFQIKGAHDDNVNQGLYIEDLAKDHLKQIAKFHVEKLLQVSNCMRLRLDQNDYQFVMAMNGKW